MFWISWIISAIVWSTVSSAMSKIFLQGPKDRAVLTGHTSVLLCNLAQNTTFRTVSAKVPYIVTWTFKPLGSTTPVQIVKWTRHFNKTETRYTTNEDRYPNTEIGHLVISNTSMTDAGEYTCTSNITSPQLSAQLYVVERPSCHNQNAELYFNHIATFDCHVRYAGNGVPEVDWKLGKRTMNTTTEHHNATSLTATLQLKAGVNMNGHIYNCHITYPDLLSLQCQAMPPLKVYIPAAVTDLTIRPIKSLTTYDEDSNVHFTCSARGYPNPIFTWTFTPQNKSASQVQISSLPYYDIPKLRSKDEGEYECSVNNEINGVIYSDKKNVKISMIEKPVTKPPVNRGQDVSYKIHKNTDFQPSSIDATTQTANSSIFTRNASNTIDYVETSFKYLSIFSPYAIGALVSAGLAVLLIIIFVIIAMRMKMCVTKLPLHYNNNNNIHRGKKEHKMREKMARSHDETLDDQEVELLDESVQLQSEYRPKEYSKLRTSWEVPRRDIRLVEQIGKGSYVEIWKGRIRKSPNTNEIVRVCIKKLNNEASEKEKRFFVSELEVLKMIKTHTNVIRLAGSYTANEPWLMMLELATEGTLQEFLLQFRPGHHVVIKRGESEGGVRLRSQSLSAHKLLALTAQTASGLAHLKKFKLIYYRLRTASVLCSKGGICKLSGFGFAQDITDRNMYEPASAPTRWMSPESLVENMYNIQTDIWSFGILVWEIFHFGITPYPSMGPQEVLEKVHSGYRMARPNHMSPELYHVMLSCWNSNPDDRPGYEYILDRLTVMASNHAAHIFMEKLPEFVKAGDGLDILS